MRTIGYNITCTPGDYGEEFDCEYEECIAGTAFDGIFEEDCGYLPADYTLRICPPEVGTLTIPLADIMSNDIGVSPEEAAIAYALVQDEDRESITLNADNTALVYTSNMLGTRSIAYAVTGCDGQLTNASIITINVTLTDDPECVFACYEEPYPDCSTAPYSPCITYYENCNDLDETSPCNLVCNAGFCARWSGSSPSGGLSQLGYRNGGTYDLFDWLVTSRFVYFTVANTDDIPFNRVRFAATFTNPASVATYVNIEPDQNYLFAYDIAKGTSDQSGPVGTLNMEILKGQDIILGDINNLPQLPPGALVHQRTITSESSPFDRYLGEFSLAADQWEDYSAIRLYGTEDGDQGYQFTLGNFEVVPDNFSAGDDFSTLTCGELAKLGDTPFCMLAGVKVNYSWYELDAAGNQIEPALLTYSQSDGILEGENTLFVSPFQTTTYRLVREIDILGNLPADYTFAINSDEVTITVIEGFPIADFNIIETGACGVFDFLSDPSTSGNTHAWYLDGVLISDSENISGISLLGGTHTISHTVGGTCGESESEQIIEVMDCITCDCTALVIGDGGDILLTDLISQEILPVNGYDLTGSCMTVNGNLIINQDYTLTGGEIFMEDGASIFIDIPFTLTLNNVNENAGIHGCDAMWEGIKLGVRAGLVMNNCLIKDAHLAVDIANPCELIDIKHTVFENNYIGLYSGPDPVAVQDFRWFYGNTFRYNAAAPYLPPYAGQLNDPEDRNFAGIKLTNLSNHLRLGLSPVFGFAANNFENLRNGILTENLSLHVTNANFTNITRNPGEPDTGFGVRHRGSNGHDFSIVGAPGTSGAPNVIFDNCTIGVAVKGTNSWLIGNEFVDVGNAIMIQESILKRIYVSANSIEASSRGIVLSNNDPVLDIQVFNNNITVGELPSGPVFNLPGVGIEVNETGLVAGNEIGKEITNNAISTLNGDVALRLQSAVRYTTRDNAISLQGNGGIGIDVRGVNRGNLTNNTITGYYLDDLSPQQAELTGIQLALSPNLILECNTVSDLATGVRAFGECLGTDIVGTRFQPPFIRGLHYTEQLTIAQQPHHGNIWEPGTYGYNGEGAAAVNDVPEDEFNIALQNQLYDIHTTIDGFRPPSFAFPMLPGDPFFYADIWFNQDNGTPLNCLQFDSGGFTDNDEKELAKKAINGNLVSGEYASTRSWISRWQVYEQYKDEVVTDYQINQFLADVASEDLGQLYTREQSRGQLHLGDAANYEQLQNQAGRLQQLIAELAELDRRGAQGESVQQERLEVQLTMTELIGNLTILDDDRMATRDEEGQTYVNTSPTFSMSPAEQLARVQAIYGKTLGQGNLQLNDTNQSMLLSIGENCPLVGGAAIYKARSLYLLLVDPMHTFIDNCPPSQALVTENGATDNVKVVGKQQNITSEFFPETITAWPNPADRQLTIRLMDDVHRLQITDGFGKAYLRNRVNEQSSLVIRTNSWPDGLYLVTAFDNQGRLIDSQKIIITH